jgi:hypothetical protein
MGFVGDEMEKEIDLPVPKDMAGGDTHNRHKKSYSLMQKAGVLSQITEDEKYAVYVRDMLMKYVELYLSLGIANSGELYYSQSLLRNFV